MTEKPTYEELEKKIRELEKAESYWNHEKKKFDRQEESYRLLLDISTKCINIPIDAVENAINTSLKRIGKFVNADRAYIFKYDFEKNIGINTYEWCAGGIDPQIQNLQESPIDAFPEWVESHRNGEPVVIHAVSELPADSMKDILEQQHIKSLISIPMFQNGILVGFSGFDSVKKLHKYVTNEIKIIQIFNKIVMYLNQYIEKEQERIKSENELIESKKRFAALSDASFEAIFFFEKGVCLDQNKTAEKLFGYTLEEAIGKNGVEWVIPDDREKVKNNRLSHHEKTYELTALRKDGTTFPCEIQSKTIKKQDGSTRVIALRDITERKQAEDALKESEFFFSQMFEQSTASTCFYNPSGTIIRVNNEFCKMFGVEEKTIITSDYNIYKDQAAIDKGVIPFVRDIFGKKKTRNWEIDYDIDLASESTETPTSKKGKIFLEIFGYPVLNPKGDLEYVVLQHYDITERRLADEKIKTALHEKEVLLQEVHHRVKNNMQVISSLLFLQATRSESEQVRQELIESQQRVYAMAMVHEELYSGQNLSAIDFSEYLNRLVNHLQGAYSNQSDIRVVFEMDRIEIDINQAVPCSLILNELITNAFKHAFPDGRKGNIHIKLYIANDKEVGLEFSDNGVGIAANIELSKPSSLGLKLVNDLLKKQLKGSLDVTTAGRTTFTLRWPLFGRNK